MNPKLFFYAFRYALGRRTWVPGEVCRDIKKNIDMIDPVMRRQMIKEITAAENAQRLGMDIDAVTWTDLRDFLTKSLE